MRHRYLAAVLRQDVGYYDTTATSGEAMQCKGGREQHTLPPAVHIQPRG